MDKTKYFERYQKYREVYEKHFREDADIFWKMYWKHHREGVTYEKLGDEYGYSQSTLRRIFRRIEDVLDNPERYVLEDSHQINLSGSVMFPNAFLDAKYRLSSTADGLFVDAIRHQQCYRFSVMEYREDSWIRISREQVLKHSSQLKNVERRRRVFEELKAFRITLKDGKSIKVFEDVEDQGGSMVFRFAEECLDYVDCWRWIRKELGLTSELA